MTTLLRVISLGAGESAIRGQGQLNMFNHGMAVNVMRLIASRIDMVEEILTCSG